MLHGRGFSPRGGDAGGRRFNSADHSISPARKISDRDEEVMAILDQEAGRLTKRPCHAKGAIAESHEAQRRSPATGLCTDPDTNQEKTVLRWSDRPPPSMVKNRPGRGGVVVHYVDARDTIALANRVFGHDGWSVSIVSKEIVLEEQHREWAVTTELMLRVCIPPGQSNFECSKENVGYATASDMSRHEARLKSYKLAYSDAIKRCLRLFGPVFGG